MKQADIYTVTSNRLDYIAGNLASEYPELAQAMTERRNNLIGWLFDHECERTIVEGK